MTLIACLHPNQSRTLFADILISTTANGGDLVLPSRAYVSLDRTISMRPDALRRKVIEIAPELVILWAGEYCEAHQLAVRATEWFGDCARCLSSRCDASDSRSVHPSATSWRAVLGSRCRHRRSEFGPALCCGRPYMFLAASIYF